MPFVVTMSYLKVGSLSKDEQHFGSDHGRVVLVPRKRVSVEFGMPAPGRLGFVCGKG